MPDQKFNYFAGNNNSDIAIVSRTKGPQNTEFLFFISAHDMGVTATVDYFTNPDTLENFQRKFLTRKKNFTAIYRARGYERTNMSLETILVVPF